MINKKSFFSVSDRSLTKVGMMIVAVVVVGAPFLAQAATLNRQLDIGSQGADVSSLQTYLAGDSSLYPEGLVTGYFGSLTSAAVSKFQVRNSIDSVGRVGPITLNALNLQMGGGTAVSNVAAPSIFSLSVIPSSTSVSVSWSTDQNAAALVYYSVFPLAMTESGPNSAVTVSGSSFLLHTDLRRIHSGVLSGLQPNTTYNYVIYVRNGNGNESVTSPSTFRTLN